jgi:hypothetical protein
MGAKYTLRVLGAGAAANGSVPAACLVAEVMRTAMEMEGAGEFFTTVVKTTTCDCQFVYMRKVYTTVW